MAQFDVHRNATGNPDVPYLLDVQSDLLKDMKSRVVVPLIPLSIVGRPMTRLEPVFDIGNAAHVMVTTDMAGVSIVTLGTIVCSLQNAREAIVQALDFIHQGY